jgi:hypothetical protein
MVHVVEHFGQKTTLHNGATAQVFSHAFWTFQQCVRAFEHCRPLISIDGTFLTGRRQQFFDAFGFRFGCD